MAGVETLVTDAAEHIASKFAKNSVHKLRTALTSHVQKKINSYVSGNSGTVPMAKKKTRGIKKVMAPKKSVAKLVNAEKKALRVIGKSKKVLAKAAHGSGGIDSHGVAHRAGSYQQMTSGTRGTMKSVCRGTDKIAVITIGNGCDMGQILYSCSLSPSAFPGTALSLESAMWNTFKWRKCRFTFVSDQADVVVGSVVQAIDPDATSDGGYPVGGLVNLTSFAALETSHDSPLRQEYSSTTGKFDPRMTALYVRPSTNEELFTSAGTFVFVANTALTKASSSTLTIDPSENLGTLYLEYEVEFQGRNLDIVAGYSGAYYLSGLTGTRSAPFTGFTQPEAMVGNLPIPDIATASIAWSGLPPFAFYYVTINLKVSSGSPSTFLTAAVNVGTIAVTGFAYTSSSGYDLSLICQTNANGALTIQSLDCGEAAAIGSSTFAILGVTEDCAWSWFKVNSTGPPLLDRPTHLSRHVRWNPVKKLEAPTEEGKCASISTPVDLEALSKAIAKLNAK